MNMAAEETILNIKSLASRPGLHVRYIVSVLAYPYSQF